MITVSSSEFEKDVEHYEKLALTQPVRVTNGGGKSVVLLSESEYERFKRCDTREVLGLEDFTDEDVEAIRNTPIHPDAHLYDHEVE